MERYHSIIRRVYHKLKSDHEGLPHEVLLSLAVHAVNNTAGPDGIVPTLLVFGSLPRLPLPAFSSLPLTQQQRFDAMKTARDEMMAITAQRRIREALKTYTRKSQPFIPEEGQHVLVYREGTKRFEGPFVVHSYDNRKTVHLLVPNSAGHVKVVPFSLSAVKPIPLDTSTTNIPDSSTDAATPPDAPPTNTAATSPSTTHPIDASPPATHPITSTALYDGTQRHDGTHSTTHSH